MTTDRTGTYDIEQMRKRKNPSGWMCVVFQWESHHTGSVVMYIQEKTRTKCLAHAEEAIKMMQRWV